MYLDTQRGRYLPSFYCIRVETIHEFHGLSHLPAEVLSTYFHEYFHFLQDLTTNFCLNAAWNSYDRILRLIKFSQEETGDLILPLQENENFDVLAANDALLDAVLADKTPRNTGSLPLQSPIIDAVVLRMKGEAELRAPGAGINFVEMVLTDNEGNKADYWFGGIAVMETMTYLIQDKFFHPPGTPEFPYKSGILLANYLSKTINWSNEFIFALCDVALFSPYPGWTFYEIVVKMDESNVNPLTSEDIYSFGFDFITRKFGLWDKFLKSKEHLLGLLNNLYGHPLLENEKKWLVYVIEEGFQIRMENPHFMLNLYRSNVPISSQVIELYTRLGAPEVINMNGERWFAAPGKLTAQTAHINTSFLSILTQIHDLLLYGKKSCAMIQDCKYATPPMPVDNYCSDSPWLKYVQGQVCPFTALWRAFGLDSKRIMFKKENI